MICRNFVVAFAVVVLQVFAVDQSCAQIGYGVDNFGQLFKFDVNGIAPAPVTNIGAPLSFVPEGIDFRPSSRTLYAIDVEFNTTQLYTINIDTGAASTVGAALASAGAGYDLTTSTLFGFDFNPKTLQDDGSMRIRLVNASGQNLRLNSSTGQIANIDGALTIPPPAESPRVDAIAYINNIAEQSGPPSAVTTLYDIYSLSPTLYTQSPPNSGTLNFVGPLGVVSLNAIQDHFDIFTDPSSTDTTIGGDRGYAVIKRPTTGPARRYHLLYNVNLGTGAATQGRAVGVQANFDGGFAVLPIPEPTSALLAALATFAWTFVRGKRATRADRRRTADR